MSGRLPPHVNQNNRNNDIEAASGCDLRFKFIAQKMKEAGFATAMIGKSHLGARSPANLPINRGFDVHFGFLKGGEDHYSQGSGSVNGEVQWLRHQSDPAFRCSLPASTDAVFAAPRRTGTGPHPLRSKKDWKAR